MSRCSVAWVAAAATLSGCGGPKFDPPSLIESVRILATAADKPYALPGDTVNTQVLAYDGRSSKPAPMGVWWIPKACINPRGDLYYSCYESFGSSFQPGVDLTSQLIAGTSFSFQLPSDVITSHPTTSGDPYGLAVTFVIACAGHVEYTPNPAGGAPDALPFGCFDSNHNQLGADDFVFAYSLVYSFNDRTNANPVITDITFNGGPVNPTSGFTLPHCTNSNIDDCPTSSVDTSVPPSSQEVDPSNLDANGNPLKEEIWVDYYLTAGKVKNDTEILYDPTAGALSNTADDLYAPQSVGSYMFWSVVHDDRGGCSWVQVPMQAN